ncbi:MAG: alpha/beta fold hydrolase [Rhodopirellula sp.]|nr:alpha/beta fold hydrolase [Rhodopirellula sp.]
MNSHLRLPRMFVTAASHRLRTFTFTFVAGAALVVLSSSTPIALAQNDATKVDGVPGVVTTTDGWDIHYTYWESPMGKEAPVVILLHGTGQARLVWNALPLAKELAKAQFAVIAVDLRKHGESKASEGASIQARSSKLTKNDYTGMVDGDLEAIKKFIYSEHQAQRLNMRKLGLVAVDMSTVIALNWTALDWLKKPFDDAPTLAAKTPRGQDVQSVVLVSPVDSLSGLGTIDSTRFIRATGISVLLLSSKKTSSENRTAAKMYTQLGGTQQDEENKRIYNIGSDIKLSGTNLLAAQPQLQAGIQKFLEDHVMKHVAPWQDRESRLK